MRQLYENLMNAYLFGHKDQIFSLGVDLVNACKENPFPAGTEAHEVFFQAMRNYHLWTSGVIDSRVSGRRLAKNIDALVALEAPNPFPEVKEIKASAEPVHVMGVVPEKEEAHEEKKPFFNRNKKR